MLKLIIEDDEGHTTVVPLAKKEITIGRKEGNTIRLTERNVSRHHARLLRSNGSFFIEDLDSYNGVKVNGDRISSRTTIREGDLVEIGDYHLALQQSREQPEAKPTPVPASPPSLPTQSDGATAILRLPVEQKASTETARARAIPVDQVAGLVVTSTDLAGQRFELTRTEMTIGRTEENDIVVAHRSISAQHAKIVFDAGVYRVIDMDSANGMLVNGEEYARVDLRDGDIIELGHVKLRFVPAGERLPDTAPQPVAPAPAPDLRETVLEQPPLLPRKKFPILPVLGGAVVLLLVGGYFAFFHGRQTTSTTPAAAQAPAAGNQPQENPTGRLYKEGLAKFKRGDYTGARVTLQAALQADPQYPGVPTMLEKVKDAEKNARLLNQARQAMDEQRWDDAWKLLGELSPGSTFLGEVESLRSEVKRKVITYHLNKARLAMKSKDLLAEAERHLQRVAEVDPKNPVAKRLGKQIRKLRATPARVASAAVRPPSNRREKPHRGGDAWKRSGVSKQDVRTALKNKKYHQVIRLLELVLDANPRECFALAQLGAAYIFTNNTIKGYELYKRFLHFCPRNKYAPKIRGMVKDFENRMR